jgi:hypothetical protein
MEIFYTISEFYTREGTADSNLRERSAFKNGGKFPAPRMARSGRKFGAKTLFVEYFGGCFLPHYAPLSLLLWQIKSVF